MEVLRDLARERPAFHSEADLQHELAWRVREVQGVSELRLERGLWCEGQLLHVDLFFRLRSMPVAVEVKYWKKAADFEHAGERFRLLGHGAADLARYDFWADVRRLQQLTSTEVVAAGVVVALTNDPTFWEPARRETNDAAFRLDGGRVVSGELAWGSGAGRGTIIIPSGSPLASAPEGQMGK